MATPETTMPIVPDARPRRAGRVAFWLLSFVFLAGAGAFWYIGPERIGRGEFGFEEPASVTFLLAYEVPRIISAPPNPNAAAEFEAYRQTLAAMVKSDFVITRALDPALRSGRDGGLPPAKDSSEVAARLKVEFTAPQLMRVSLHGYPRPQAVELLKRIADELLQEVVFTAHQQELHRLTQLEITLTKIADDIRRLRSNMKSFLDKIAPDDSTIDEARVRAYELAADEQTRMRLELLKEEAELEILNARADEKGAGSGAAGDEREHLRTSIAIRRLAIERLAQEADKIQQMIGRRGQPGSSIELESMREEIEDRIQVRQKIAAEIQLLKIEQDPTNERTARVRLYGPVH